MHKAATSAVCAVLLLMSSLGATQLAATYTTVLILPFTSGCSGSDALPLALALSAALSATWHPFDLMTATVSALVAGAALVTAPTT